METIEEVEVYILRDILNQLQKIPTGKGTVKVFVDDETEPFEGKPDRTYVVNKLAKERVFSTPSFQSSKEIMGGVDLEVWHALVKANLKIINTALLSKEGELRWIQKKDLVERGRLLFDPITKEAKLGNVVWAFKNKQLIFIEALVYKGKVGSREMYGLLYPGTSKSALENKSLAVINRDIDGNILKAIRKNLRISAKKRAPKNPGIFLSNNNYYEIIG